MAMVAATLRTSVRWWWLIGLLTVLGAGTGLAYALLSPREYTATAYVAVVAQNTGDSTAVSYAQAYSRIAGQGDALHAAVAASQGTISVKELRRSVRASASPDAPVIELTGTAGSGEHAADLVNLLADGLVRTANSHAADTRMRLSVLSGAAPPADPTSPQLPLAVAVGAAAGLLLGGLAFLARGERTHAARRGAERETVDAPQPDAVDATQPDAVDGAQPDAVDIQPDAVDATRPSAVGATQPDAVAASPVPRVTWTGRAPVTVVHPSATRVPEGWRGDGGASGRKPEQEEAPETARGAAAGPKQENPADGGQDTTDEGDEVRDDNDEEPSGTARRQRRHRGVASKNR